MTINKMLSQKYFFATKTQSKEKLICKSLCLCAFVAIH